MSREPSESKLPIRLCSTLCWRIITTTHTTFTEKLPGLARLGRLTWLFVIGGLLGGFFLGGFPKIFWGRWGNRHGQREKKTNTLISCKKKIAIIKNVSIKSHIYYIAINFYLLPAYSISPLRYGSGFVDCLVYIWKILALWYF